MPSRVFTALAAVLTLCASACAPQKKMAPAPDPEIEITRLKQENENLRMENDKLRAENQVLKSSTETIAGLAREIEELLEALRKQGIEGVGIVKGPNGESGVRMEADILFASGKADLTPTGTSILKRVAAELKTRPVRLNIVGHTDTDPINVSAKENPTRTNLELGMRRALAVMVVLKKEGIPESRMTLASKGFSEPVDPANKRRNRRVDIWIVK